MSKYLLRLLTFSLVLGILPAVLIGIVSYSIASGAIEEKVKEGNMQWLAQTQQRVEQTLKTVEKSATQFANSSLVKASMTAAYTQRDFEPLRDLSKELYNLQSGDAVITQAYLVNLNHGWALNLNTMKPLEELENRDEFLEYAKKPRSIHWYAGAIPADGAESADPESAGTITLVHKIPILPLTDQPQGLVVIRIAAADIAKVLVSSDSSNRSYILDRTGEEIPGAGGGGKTAYQAVNAAVVQRLEAAPDSGQGQFNMELESGEEAIIYRSSGYNGWTYVSAVAIGEITKETRKIAGLTFAVCAAILLLVLAAALYGSRRMYRPIRHLLDVAVGLGPSAPDQAVTRRKDELEFIQASMESLAVSRNRLEQQMLGQAGHLKEFFVLKLFTGQLSENDYMVRSALYGFPSGWKRLGVLALQIDNLQETRYQEEDRELLLYAVNNIAQEVLPASCRFTPILLNHSQVTLIATDREEPEAVRQFLYESAERIKKNVEQYLQLQVSIGISKPFRTLGETVKAHGESLSALKARISLGADIIVHYGDIENHPAADSYEYTHLKVLEERLIYALQEMQPNSASEIVRQYLDALLLKEGDLYEHQMLLLQLVGRIIRMLQDQGIPLKKALEDEEAVERLLHLQTRDEILHWFESRLFTPILRVLSEKSEIQYVKIADKLVRLIQEQYDREISLESCAQALNYHPVYLSRVFKREIGMTFSDYLSDYRMKMAKMMLETTDKKVSEIGEKLQYKNISAFIRSFRRMYDITPGQYRERIMRGGTE